MSLTLKVPEKLQLYGLYVYYVVHICDFGMLRVKSHSKLDCLDIPGNPNFLTFMFCNVNFNTPLPILSNFKQQFTKSPGENHLLFLHLTLDQFLVIRWWCLRIQHYQEILWLLFQFPWWARIILKEKKTGVSTFNPYNTHHWKKVWTAYKHWHECLFVGLRGKLGGRINLK